MKRILVAATGGTISSTPHQDGLAPGLSINQMAHYFEHKQDVAVDFHVLMNKDSTNMQPEDWLAIARFIHENQDRYDSFIITHGTDTMAYTASALSYLLYNLQKTVVLTGSQVPVSFRRTDAKKNIKDALTFAKRANLPGVYIVFDGKAILGTRAVKMRTKSYDAFESINYPYIATIDGERLRIDFRPKSQVSVFPRHFGICPDVFLLKVFPGLSPVFFDFLETHVKGLIIESFGNGGLSFENRNLTAGVKRLVQKGIPVIITTQCLEEGQNMELYEVGKRVADAGGITAGDMNTEAVVTKLMWVLAQTSDPAVVKQMMQTPIAHDLDDI
ncbi:asparaginase [Sporolactobacillus sp. THM19-2]|jgi:L-asparaginase|uniref:asparaginase n=1 Tax=Sporolactobacillus sp. THM19-2 TaxID=2511171 RepID=UPI00101F8396|nr:asparaginase [Sporolactobacillus sp. THM19-2]RYL91642.1 asparaginase [Sporolactobacillus sp. THM19-2]